MTGAGIRRCATADARLLSELATEAFPLACPPETTTENIRAFCEHNLSPGAFEKYLASAEIAIWIAEDSDTPVGYVMSVAGEPGDPDIAGSVTHRPTVEISKLYVLSSHHGSGLAGKLLALALEHARNDGAASVWLGVNRENRRANRFYEKSGFALVGERFFQVGESLESDVIREKVLDSLA